MDGHDTYASHLNGIPLGLEYMRWALTDIGRLIGRDDRWISEAAERERQSEQSAPQETHEERQRQAQREAREFSRLQSAAYNATGEERKAAQKELYVITGGHIICYRQWSSGWAAWAARPC